jgi:hypothetical protein
MSISNNYIPVKQSGDGVTTNFSGNWNVIAASYIRVYWEDKTTGVQTLKIKDTHYTLSFNSSGFIVTFLTGFVPASTVWVVIGRQVALDQNVPYTTSQGFQGPVTENSFDKVTAMIQDNQDAINRSPKFALGSTTQSIIAEPVDGQFWVWDGDNVTSVAFADIGVITADAIFTGLAANDFLQYNGTVWVNLTPAAVATAIGAATLTGAESLSNKTLVAPIISGIPVGIIEQVCQGRLTLTTGVPVTTANVTAAATVYFTPYKGNHIALYSSSAWRLLTFTELSISLASGFSSGKPYDVFAYNNAGVVALETLVWTNDTTRATALTTQDGVLVKTGDTTRRYIGTFYTTGAATTEDSETKRFVWNYYNRASRKMYVKDTTDTWNYSVAAYQQANASALNQLDMVIGVSEDIVIAWVQGFAINSTSTFRQCNTGVGLDNTTIITDTANSVILNNSFVTGVPSARYNGFPGAGRHFLTWLERGSGSDTQTWSGDNGGSAVQSSIQGIILG